MAEDEAMYRAAADGNLDEVKRLIGEGADVNWSVPQSGNTALIAASTKGDMPMATYLVEEAGASLEAKDNGGSTALTWGSLKGHLPLVVYLVDKGASLESVDMGGATALMSASAAGQLPIVSCLIEKGAALETTDEDGNTALIIGSRSGHLPIVSHLIDAGADPTARNQEGNTAFAAVASTAPEVHAYLKLIEEKLEAAAESAAALVEQEAARAASVEMLTATVAELDAMVQGPQEEARKALRSGKKTIEQDQADREKLRHAMIDHLATKVAKGMVVGLRHFELAVKYRYGSRANIDGRMSPLEEIVAESQAIYTAAKASMREADATGFKDLLRTPQVIKPKAETIQLSTSLDTLLEQAAAAQDLMKSKLASGWEDHPELPSCQVPVALTQAVWVDKAISPGVKAKARAVHKVEKEYRGHANQITDLARVTLEYRQCGRLVRAIDTELAENGMSIITLKNGYLYPTLMGYADLSMTVEISLDDGTPYIVEVLANDQAMVIANRQAREHYDKIRAALPDVCKGTGLHPAELEAFLTELLDEKSSFDLVSDLLAMKTASPNDVLTLAREMEATVAAGSHSLDLDDLGKLADGPNKRQASDGSGSVQWISSDMAVLDCTKGRSGKKILAVYSEAMIGSIPM